MCVRVHVRAWVSACGWVGGCVCVCVGVCWCVLCVCWCVCVCVFAYALVCVSVFMSVSALCLSRVCASVCVCAGVLVCVVCVSTTYGMEGYSVATHFLDMKLQEKNGQDLSIKLSDSAKSRVATPGLRSLIEVNRA